MPEYEHTVVGALRRAAQLIRERGFGQGRYVDVTTGRLCAKGALHLAVCGRPSGPFLSEREARALMARAHGVLEDLLPEPDDYGVDRLVAWSDQDGRTMQEVVAMLEAAADEEERRGEASGDPGGQREDHHGGGD